MSGANRVVGGTLSFNTTSNDVGDVFGEAASSLGMSFEDDEIFTSTGDFDVESDSNQAGFFSKLSDAFSGSTKGTNSTSNLPQNLEIDSRGANTKIKLTQNQKPLESVDPADLEKYWLQRMAKLAKIESDIKTK